MRSSGAPTRQDEATPLREFDWSDGVVGMGFFPSEVALPPDWTWTGRRDPPGPAPRVP
jgi:hypothetical protein